MNRLMFGLLGPTIVIGERGEIVIHGRLRRRLLARLLIAAGQPVAVERLKEDLWNGAPPASAGSTLKSHVSLLRRALGPDRLEGRNHSYLLRLDAGELDIDLFEEEAAAGRDLLRSSDATAALELLDRGLRRWRGPALADVADTSWGHPEATRIEELRAAVLECWLEARLALGESHQVIPAAEAAIAEHPLREQLWAKLITALYRSGRQGDALRAYQRLRQFLGEELGIDPSPELVALESSILRQEPALTATSARVRHPRSEPTGNLPPEGSSFVARPKELADLAGWIAEPCLLTLAGPGGTGKTRLALQAARQAAPEFDAIWVCELAAVTDPADIVRELGLALQCADTVGVDLIDLISRRLSGGKQLVVLDNCEHLLDGCAALVARLRRDAANLRILVTSRAPLQVEGEVVCRVPPMSVPGAAVKGDDLLGYESVRLFVERARFQQPAFSIGRDTGAAVATICTRLDGMPLAIELAAARLRTMSVSDIVRGLDNRFQLLNTGARTAPARQRSLQALIDWSYDLLDEHEQALLGRLAVYASSFDADAAQAVALTGSDSAGRVLGSLVDNSLVQFDFSSGPSRYRMLETVRQYALGKISPEAELNARSAHARHFLNLVLQAVPHFADAEHAMWRARLDADDENLRAAFVTMVSEAGSQQMLAFAEALCRYWSSRGSYGDEMSLIESALRRPDASEPTSVRGQALAAAGFVYFRRGELARAQQCANEALVIARQLRLPSLAADALRTSAWVIDRRGDRSAAKGCAAEAVEMALAGGDTHLIARAYDVRGAMAHADNPAQARADYSEAFRYCQSTGDRQGQATTLNNLAVLELDQGAHAVARRYFDQALVLVEGVGDPALTPFIHYGVGLTSILDEDYDSAQRALADALRESGRTGQRSLEAYVLLGTAIARARTKPDLLAALLLGAAQAMFDRMGERPEPTEAALCDQARSALATALGDDLEMALARGRALPAAECVRLATEACRRPAGML